MIFITFMRPSDCKLQQYLLYHICLHIESIDNHNLSYQNEGKINSKCMMILSFFSSQFFHPFASCHTYNADDDKGDA